MGSEDEVDPDANTLMPTDRQEPEAPAWTSPVTLTASDGTTIDADLVDVTTLGVSIEVPRALPMDAEYAFELPSDPPATASGRVVWNRAGAGPRRPSAGLDFTAIDGGGFEAVATLIAQIETARAQ